MAATRARIAAACAAAGRDPAELTLIAVTKTYPAADVLDLARLGLTDFGENRDQEASGKAAEVAAGLTNGTPVTWHFVGQLQTNKARHVAGYASVVHSVDRVRLARALGQAVRAQGARDRATRLACLVQVSLDPAAADRGGADRAGVPPGGLAEVAAAIEAEDGLTLGGLMAVAPLNMDPVRAFAPLRELAEVVRAVSPEATMISAGMSGDLEAAVACGATHLRIGTALLGDRRLPFR